MVLLMLLRETMILSKMSNNEMHSDNRQYSKYQYHVIGDRFSQLHRPNASDSIRHSNYARGTTHVSFEL